MTISYSIIDLLNINDFTILSVFFSFTRKQYFKHLMGESENQSAPQSILKLIYLYVYNYICTYNKLYQHIQTFKFNYIIKNTIDNSY